MYKFETGTPRPFVRKSPNGVCSAPSVFDGSGTPMVIHQRRSCVGKGTFRDLIRNEQMRSGDNVNPSPLSIPPFPI
eukprot:2324015-Alexandrium_andersonii.AAC.1